MCRRRRGASERAKVLTLREVGEVVRPRGDGGGADEQAKKPIISCEKEVGG